VDDPVDPIKVEVNDRLPISDALVGHKRGADGTEALRTVDSLQSAGADYSPGSPPAFTLQGENRHGEQGALAACSVLLEHLSSHGEVYSAVREVKGERGVDCVADGPTGTINVQVTRAVRGDFRADLATAPDRTVSRGYEDVHEAADDLRDAVRDKFDTLMKLKPPVDLGRITLVLDSRETLSHVLNKGVAASFQQRHGPWAQGLGFHAVWLVGPTADFVVRLA
jgi:hypothetical protein